MKKIPTIRIKVESGLAYVYEKPKGLRVHIKDYDVEGVDDPDVRFLEYFWDENEIVVPDEEDDG